MSDDNPSPLDPAFWQALGIEPIVINPNDPSDVAAGMDAITTALANAANDSKQDSDDGK